MIQADGRISFFEKYNTISIKIARVIPLDKRNKVRTQEILELQEEYFTVLKQTQSKIFLN